MKHSSLHAMAMVAAIAGVAGFDSPLVDPIELTRSPFTRRPNLPTGQTRRNRTPQQAAEAESLALKRREAKQRKRARGVLP
jgi:hypothetical protein